MSGPFEVGPGGGEVGPGGDEAGPGSGSSGALIGVTQAAAALSLTGVEEIAATIAITQAPAVVGALNTATIGVTQVAASAAIAADTNHAAIAITQAAAITAETAEETEPGQVTVTQGPAAVAIVATVAQAAIAVTQAPARVAGMVSESFPLPPPSGAPGSGHKLWRGQVLDIDLDRDDAILRVTLTCEDMNRLPGVAAVGAPTGPPDGSNSVGGDGTVTWVDAAAYAFGDGSGLGDGSVYRHFITTYWPGGNDGTFDDVHQLNPDYSDPLTYDWQTSRTMLDSVLDEFLAGQGAFGARWRDADKVHHWTRLAPTGDVSEFAIPAPYNLSSDGPWDGSTVPANIRVGRSSRSRRKRAYINGGTPTAQRFVVNPDAPLRAGDEYISAPGATSAGDAEFIGTWQLAKGLSKRITGTAIPLPHLGSVGYHGWRVGQTICLTDPTLSRLTGLSLAAIPTIIQSIEGELVGPGPGLKVNLEGVDLSNLKVTWQGLRFSDRLGGVGTATIAIEISDPEETVTISELAEVIITEDGTSDIQYTLGWGDIPAGSLARQAARGVGPKLLPDTREGPPIYTFGFLVTDPGIMPGQATTITAQAQDQTGIAVKRAGIAHTWSIEQYADDDALVVSDQYSLTPAEGTNMLTDTNGQTAVALTRATGTVATKQYWIWIDAVPLDE